jgi:hypothetical protein
LESSGIKTYPVRQIIRSTDPVHHKKSMAEIVRVLKNEKADNLTLQDLFAILAKFTSKPGLLRSIKNMQMDHLATFINSTIMIYM